MCSASTTRSNTPGEGNQETGPRQATGDTERENNGKDKDSDTFIPPPLTNPELHIPNLLGEEAEMKVTMTILRDNNNPETPIQDKTSINKTYYPGPNMSNSQADLPDLVPSSRDTAEEEEAISKAPELTEKREPLKTPKSYFFESLQKRRNRALTKSQSAARFLANA